MSPWASFKALYLGAIRRSAAANLPWLAAILILPASCEMWQSTIGLVPVAVRLAVRAEVTAVLSAGSPLHVVARDFRKKR